MERVLSLSSKTILMKLLLLIGCIALSGCAYENSCFIPECSTWSCEDESGMWFFQRWINNECARPPAFDDRCDISKQCDRSWDKPDDRKARQAPDGRQCLEWKGETCERWSEVSEDWKGRLFNGYSCPFTLFGYRGAREDWNGTFMWCTPTSFSGVTLTGFKKCTDRAEDFLETHPECGATYIYPTDL